MESEITPNSNIEQSSPKFSKFTIILLVLIVIAAGSLGYLVYKSNAESETATNAPSTSTSIAEPVSSTTPTESNPTPHSVVIETIYSVSQVAANNSKSSCWTIIDSKVYDITKYVPNHPGGEAEILKICGKDGTVLFAKPMEHKEGGASDVLAGFKIGKLAKQ
jgi:cytochrome b involved in lipid metabolism